jgi:AcrR family transcriptional regulator
MSETTELTTRTGHSSPKTQAGQHREEMLISTAARSFYERGYDATTLQIVADELGLLKGSLYYYIRSKDDLLYAVIMRQHRSAMALIERCKALDASPRERLLEFVGDYARSLDEDHVFVSVYLREINRLGGERRQTIVEERRAYVQWVVDVLREGQAAGEFRADLDPEIAAQGILGMLNSAYRWYRPSGPRTAAEIVGEFVKLLLDGVTTA